MKITRRNASRLTGMHISFFLVVSIFFLVNTPMINASPPDAEICAFLERFHGHTCPGSLMGLRLGLAAKEALRAEGKIEARTFILACPVDGIQVATGATYGNRAITVEDRKEMRLILTDTGTGRQVQATLTREAMEKGSGFRELSGKYRASKDGSPEKSAIKKEIDDILNWYRTAPDEKVVLLKVLK